MQYNTSYISRSEGRRAADRRPERRRGMYHLHSPQYPALSPNDKLIVNLRALSHTIRDLYEGRESQKRTLILLRESDGITQRALTEKMGIQPGSASEVIGKLVAAGLVARTPNPEDRRTVNLHLTPSGRAEADSAFLQRQQRHQEMFSCLSGAERETLLTLLEKLNADWDSRYRGATSSGGKEAGPCGNM